MSWKENKPEWRSAVRFFVACFICRRIILRGLVAPGDVRSMDMIHSFVSTSLYLSILPPCGQQVIMPTVVPSTHQYVCREKSAALIRHFFTAAISKFIEIDWFLQIIVKLILPLNMKLERGLEGWWPAPTSKQEAHGWL